MTNADESSTGQKSRGGTYLLYGVIALVLYALSLGPALWLAEKGYLTADIFYVIYDPIIYLGNNTFVGEPLFWYMELWRA